VKDKLLEDLGVDGVTVLKWIFRKWAGKNELDLSGSEYGQVSVFCECGNEQSSSIKCMEFVG
jgi:hypothetical protein